MSQITECMQQALSHHQAGRLDQALVLYRVVLSKIPSHADALHLTGLVSHQQGRHDEAMIQIGEAISNRSDVASYHNNFGAACRSNGEIGRAVDAFRKAVKLQPHFSSAWSNLVSCLGELDDSEAVSGTLEQWVNQTDGCVPALEHRAAHHYATGDIRAAIADQTRLAKKQPTAHKPCLQVGILAHEAGDDDLALQAFSMARERHYRSSDMGSATVRSKLTHDAEQVDWLVSRGLVPVEWSDIGRRYRNVRDQLFESATEPLVGRKLSDAMREEIGRWYNRPIHLVDTPGLSAGALSDSWGSAEVEGRYFTSQPGVTWIDDLLRTEAVNSLRQFCMGSTVWSDFKYSGGYVGTSLANGFANGLLLQIARELRSRLPGLLGDHPLRQMWAYKYDQELTGIGVHADSAAVNVNFWITPDDANLDKASGGLKVWRKCAPMDWDFEAFNRQPAKLLDWVHETGAEEVVIPYRSNRAVIFDSNLVHRTDDFQFAPGYENRRINITMLFGSRGD